METLSAFDFRWASVCACGVRQSKHRQNIITFWRCFFFAPSRCFAVFIGWIYDLSFADKTGKKMSEANNLYGI